MKRYALDIDLYVFADSDEDAKSQSEKIVNFLKKEDDNHAAVKKLVEIPFGKTTPREITI